MSAVGVLLGIAVGIAVLYFLGTWIIANGVKMGIRDYVQERDNPPQGVKVNQTPRIFGDQPERYSN